MPHMLARAEAVVCECATEVLRKLGYARKFRGRKHAALHLFLLGGELKNSRSGVECLGRLLNFAELNVLAHLDRAFLVCLS